MGYWEDERHRKEQDQMVLSYMCFAFALWFLAFLAIAGIVLFIAKKAGDLG